MLETAFLQMAEGKTEQFYLNHAKWRGVFEYLQNA